MLYLAHLTAVQAGCFFNSSLTVSITDLFLSKILSLISMSTFFMLFLMMVIRWSPSTNSNSVGFLEEYPLSPYNFPFRLLTKFLFLRGSLSSTFAWVTAKFSNSPLSLMNRWVWIQKITHGGFSHLCDALNPHCRFLGQNEKFRINFGLMSDKKPSSVSTPPTGKGVLFSLFGFKLICSSQRVLHFGNQNRYFTACISSFKLRRHPQTEKLSGYYRLVESYRLKKEDIRCANLQRSPCHGHPQKA